MARYYKLLLGALLLAVGLLVLLPQKTSALSSTFTDFSNNPSGSNLYPMVSWADGANVTLNARDAYFKVFIGPEASGNVDITILKACSSSGLNDVMNTQITVSVTGQGTKSSTSDCSGGNIYFRNINVGTFNGAPWYGQHRSITVHVKKVGGVGIKAFKVQASGANARVTFDDGGGVYWKETQIPGTDAFSVWNSDPVAGRHSESAMDFRFTPQPCNYYDDENVFLKWYDADYGAFNETGGISWTLRDMTTGKDINPIGLWNGNNPGPTVSNGNLGSDGQYAWANVGKLEYGHEYRWRWSGVDKVNGIQVWMPFSEISQVIDCDLPEAFNVDGDSKVSPGAGGSWQNNITVTPGSRVTFRHTIDRVGSPNDGVATFKWTVKKNYTNDNTVQEINESEANSWGPFDRGYRIPASAQTGDEFCQTLEVWPKSSVSNERTSSKACVTVNKPPQQDPTPTTSTLVKRSYGNWTQPQINAEPNQDIWFKSTILNGPYAPPDPNNVFFARNSNYLPSNPYWSWLTQMSNGSDWHGGDHHYRIPADSGLNQAKCENATADWFEETDETDPETDEPIKKHQHLATNLACAVTIGGKSHASVEVRPITEQGQEVTFNGGIHTPEFFANNEPDYAYNVNCAYSIRVEGLPEGTQWLVPFGTDCSNVVSGAGNLYVPAYTYRVPDYAPMGTKICMLVEVSAGGSSINGPNPALIGNNRVDTCSEVVGGKTSASVAASTDTVEPTDTVNFYGRINTSNFHNAGQPYAYSVGCNYTVKYMRAGYAGGTSTIQSGPCSYSVSSNGSVPVVNVPVAIPGDTAYIGNQICIYFSIHPTGSNVPNGPNGNLMTHPTSPPPACVEIIARPTVKAYGGDVSAGSGFSVGSGSCLNNSASVVGWNRWTGSYYKGAGAQLAVFATNQIRGFNSGHNLTRNTSGANGVPGSAYGPANLSFANSNVSIPFSDNGGDDGLGALYGGSYGGGSCIPDYYSGLDALSEDDVSVWQSIEDSNIKAPEPNNSYTPKAYRAPAPSLTLGGGVIGNGNSTTLYVDGDVHITGNVTGANGTTTVGQIPVFTVIARGNIYIAPNVTELYGTYIAQPRDNATGKIYTCASGSVPLVPNKSNYVTCSNRLVVSGSFVADKVFLYRNNGSLYQDDGGKVPNSASYTQTAEVFQYNPLNWIRGSLSSVTQSNATFDAITSLPPVL